MTRHTEVEAGITRIGERIAQLRGEAGLSLRELADRTGVSFATIQKIEANAIVPSVATLLKIAQGLGRKASFFLEEPGEEERSIVHVRKDDRALTHVPASRLTIEDVGLLIRNALLQSVILTIEPGGESGEEPLQHPGEETPSKGGVPNVPATYTSWWPEGNKTAGTGTPAKPRPSLVAIRNPTEGMIAT